MKGHGADFIDWKCMFCCSVALFNCGGQYWFCDPCHNQAGELIHGRKKAKDCFGKNCPLKVPHPRAGRDIKKSGFPLGCSLCRSEHLEEYDAAQAQIRQLLEEEGLDAFLQMDRSLHESVKLVGGKGGKKKGPGPGGPKKAVAKKRPAKKKVFKARPAPPRPAPAELARRADQYAAKKKKPAQGAAAAAQGNKDKK